MKALVNGNFKALRIGEYVQATSDAEFIFDSDTAEDEHTAATIREIGKANGLILPGKITKADSIKKLSFHLQTMGLPTMSEKPYTQIVIEIIEAGIAEGLEDDDMLCQIVQAGVPFKETGKLFKAAMQEGGYRITAKQRKEECRAILVEAEFAPETYEEVDAMAQSLTEQVNDTEYSQAMSTIRSYAKDFEIELPKPEKQRKLPLITRVLNWILKNPDCSDEDLVEFIANEGKNDPEGKFFEKAKAYLEFGRAMREV